MQPEPRADPATNNPSDWGAHSDSSVEPTTLTDMRRGVIGNQLDGMGNCPVGFTKSVGFRTGCQRWVSSPRIVGLRHPARVDQGEALT